MLRFVQPQSPDTFRIPKINLNELELFQRNPDLLKKDKYTIKSDVDPAVVELFFARVGGDKTGSVTVENAEQLQALCDEFGFTGFDDDIRSALSDDYLTKKTLTGIRETLYEQNTFIQGQALQIQDCMELVESLTARVSTIENTIEVLFSMIKDLRETQATKIPKPADEAITAVKQETSTLRQELELIKSQVSTRRTSQNEVKIDVSARPSPASASPKAQELRRRNTLPPSSEAPSPMASCSATTRISTPVAATVATPDKRLTRSATQPELLGPESVFAYNAASPLEGIIAHLTGVCGGENLHKKGVVLVTASSCWGKGEEPQNVVELGTDSCFQSTNETPNQWVRYDFKERRVTLTSYSARSGRGNYPKSWVLEVSNEGCEQSWTVVDMQNGNFQLKGSNKPGASERLTGNFQIKKPTLGKFRYVRFRLTGKNFSGNDVLLLSSLELFGTLYELKDI